MSLGDLADLTVTNDNDRSCDLSDSKDAFKKTWNPRFTVRSQYDGIRSLAFHHSQSALLTASEDGTLKLWNLQKAVTAEKNAVLDVEPIHAFRAHRGPVLAGAMAATVNTVRVVGQTPASIAGRFQTSTWTPTTVTTRAW